MSKEKLTLGEAKARSKKAGHRGGLKPSSFDRASLKHLPQHPTLWKDPEFIFRVCRELGIKDVFEYGYNAKKESEPIVLTWIYNALRRLAKTEQIIKVVRNYYKNK